MWPFKKQEELKFKSTQEMLTGTAVCDNCGLQREQILWAHWLDSGGSGYGHHHCQSGAMGTFRRLGQEKLED